MATPVTLSLLTVGLLLVLAGCVGILYRHGIADSVHGERAPSVERRRSANAVLVTSGVLLALGFVFFLLPADAADACKRG